MIELVKLMVDSVVKLVPTSEILKQRRADQTAAIGLQLFELYRATIDLVENGYAILASLESVVAAHRTGERTGKPSGQVSAALTLVKLLNAQSNKLEALIRLYDDLRPLVQIADKSSDQDTFCKIRDLLSSKEMLIALDSGSARLRPAIGLDKECEAGGLGATWLFSEINEKGRKVGGFLTRTLAPEAEIINAFKRGQMSVDRVPWDPKITSLAEIYIQSGLGRRRLDELVQAATKLRTSFQSSFSLEDILLAQERKLRKESEKRQNT